MPRSLAIVSGFFGLVAIIDFTALLMLRHLRRKRLARERSGGEG